MTTVGPCAKCGDSRRTKQGECKTCVKLRQQVWYQQNKAKVAAYKKAWLLEHPDRSDELDLMVRVRRYGLTLDQYRQMVVQQNGLCCICDRSFGRGDIDHDHVTGRVRGILCHACNIGVGAFQDNPAILQRAILYISATSREEVA